MKLLVIILVTSQLSRLYASELSDDSVDPVPVSTSTWGGRLLWGAIGAGGSILRGATSKLAGVVLPVAEIDPKDEQARSEGEESKPESDVGEHEEIHKEEMATEPMAREEKHPEAPIIEEPLVATERSDDFGLPTAPFPLRDQTSTTHLLSVPVIKPSCTSEPRTSENTAVNAGIEPQSESTVVTVGIEPQTGFCKVFKETTEFKEKQSKMFWMICGLIALLIMFPVPLTYYFMVVRRSKLRSPV